MLRPRPNSGSQLARILDLFSLVAAVLGLVVCLRAHSLARFAPLLGLIIPIGRMILSVEYRSRVAVAALRGWQRLHEFSGGQAAIPWIATTAFVGLPFLVFDLLQPGFLGTLDSRAVIPTAASLVRDGDCDLSEFARTRPHSHLHDSRGVFHYSFEHVGGRIVSTYPQGMLPFALAVVGPAHLVGADLDQQKVLLYLEKVTAALVASLTLSLFFLVALQLGSPAAAAVTTLFLASGSRLLTTVGLGLWQHGGVTTWLLLVLLLEFRSAGSRGSMGMLVQGFGLGQMLACRPTAALLVGLFVLWVLIRSPRRAVALAVLALLAYAPWVAFYEFLYGNALGPSSIQGHTHSACWSFFHLWPMLGVLFSPGRGLFVYQPWGVLAVVTLFAWPRLRPDAPSLHAPRGWIGFCAVSVALHVFMISAWWDWAGGYCWGSRLLTDILPLLGLLSVPTVAVLLKSGAGRGVLIALALAGLSVHLPCIFWSADRWQFAPDHDHWSWANPPFLYRPPR